MKEDLYSGYHTPEVTMPEVKTEELSTVAITGPLKSLGLSTSSDQIIEPIDIESKDLLSSRKYRVTSFLAFRSKLTPLKAFLQVLSMNYIFKIRVANKVNAYN